MFCPKCGNNVSEGAAFCNNCGTQVSGAVNPANNNLIISRPGKFIGVAVDLRVIINGVEVKLGAGETMGFNLSPGMAVIKYKIWCRREKEVVINVQTGRQYSIIFKYDALWGGFKIGKESVLN